MGVLSSGVPPMVRLRTALLVFSVLLILGCSREQDGAGDAAAPAKLDTPADAVRSINTAFRRNDVAGLLKAALPPSEFAELSTQWDRIRAEMSFSDEERAQFGAAMATLTQKGAVDAIMTTLEPQLQQLDQQMAQLPMAIMMGSGLAISMIEQDENLSPEQKKQVRQIMEAMSQWAIKTPFNERARIRKAVEAAATTAEQLGMRDLEELKAMSFEQLLLKSGIVLAGLKRMLEAFDFSIDQSLDSLKVEVVSEKGDEATVRTTFTMLGVPIVSEGVLIRREGGWYGRDLLAQIAQARMAESQAAE